MRVPIPRPLPPSLRRRHFQRVTPTRSPLTARLSPPLPTHPWPWEWTLCTNKRLRPFTSQKDSETARGKGRAMNFGGWLGPVWRQLSLSPFSLPLAALCLRFSQLHGRPHVSKTKHAPGAATVTSISINQSSLAIAYPFLLLLLSHTDCINQGLDQEEIVNDVQNAKGCPTAPGPDRQ